MEIELLGAESMGVRSLATHVQSKAGSLLIDPGVSVPPRRFRLPPHESELAALRATRKRISERASNADAIIISHFHHDHYSSFETRELDLTSPEASSEVYRSAELFVKDWHRRINRAQRSRARSWARSVGREVHLADGLQAGALLFSPAFPHGENGSRQGHVIMVAVRERGTWQRSTHSRRGCPLVFASDIQCIEREPIDWILDKRPETLIVSGPPIYLDTLSISARSKARSNILRLVMQIPTVVVDHHLPRSLDYEEYLSPAMDLAHRLGHRLLSAAEFSGRENHLLEARRKQIWAADSGP